MARGGVRPGSGRKKGTIVGPRKIATIEDMRALEAATRNPSKARLCKDILAEYANFCAAIASRYQPAKDENGNPVWGDEARFRWYMDHACIYAGRAAPFESPTFRALHIQGQVTQKVEVTKDAGDVLQLDDANASMRVYRQMVAGTKVA